MRLRVLGCHGGESPRHRTSCFCIDERLLCDAGSATRSLSLSEQAQVDYVFVTHSHLDHVKGLPLLCDNVIGKRNGPVELLASPGTADALEQHLFNGLLWPDFTKVPSPDKPALRTRRLTPGEATHLESYELRIVPVHHTVECHAVIVTTKSGSLAYTGDTGPTQVFWEVASSLPKLRAVICEVSYPDALEPLAVASGHLTPRLLALELKKFKPQAQVPVLITHIKPGQDDAIRSELGALGDSRLQVLSPMQELEL